jgi:hypothetical protein
MSSPFAWHTLPTEIQLAIIDPLRQQDVLALSKVDQRTYRACVPAIFKSVKIPNFEALQRFLDNVPRGYLSHIQELFLSTQDAILKSISPRVRTDFVISLLSATPRLVKLSLQMAGSLDTSVITPFPYLTALKHLHIANCGEEENFPLSERLVVSIAASLRNLEDLSLDRVSRSKIHAPELEGVFPYIPLVIGDEDIPTHPLLGTDLSLPSLLRIPSLRKLTIRDTHLGDERWATTPVACRLEVLDLGSCQHANDAFTERIMAAVGPSVDEFTLTTAVSDNLFAKPSVTPLQSLRKLHITPYFPIESVVDTMSNLAGSPIETLSMQCYEDDVVDACAALEDFLFLKVERGPQFYDKLKNINVSVTSSLDGSSVTPEEAHERLAATRRLQAFCWDLCLGSIVEKYAASDGGERTSVTSFTDARRVKGRSNTI